MPVSSLRRQLEFLDRRGFTAITLADYCLALKGELELPKRPVILTFDDGYQDTYDLAFPLLREFGVRAVVFVLADPAVRYNAWDDGLDVPRAPLMSIGNVCAMHAAGFEIGAHGMTHADLPSITEREAWREIAHAKTALEGMLGAPVNSFAYPYGRVTERVRRLVVDAGYETACGVYTGPSRCGDDPFDILRVTIPGSITTAGFELKASLPVERLHRLVRGARAALGQVEASAGAGA